MKRAKASLFKKIVFPILLVMLFQAVLLYGTTLLGGAVTQLEANAYDIFSEKVQGRKNDLQSEMLQRWSKIAEMLTGLQEDTEAMLAEQGGTLQELMSDPDLSRQLLDEYTDELIYTLRKNSVTGVFVVLNAPLGEKYPGIYLRDTDPESNPSGYSDLQALYAPPAITQKLNVALEASWKSAFVFEGGEDDASNRFFFRPLRAAQQHPEMEAEDLAYWSPPFYLGNNRDYAGNQVIAYSVPLVGADGTVYGVAGIDISSDYLMEKLPGKELNSENKAGYLLGVTTDETVDQMTYRNLLANGAALRGMIGSGKELIVTAAGQSGFYHAASADAPDAGEVVACVREMRLYSSNTPFEGERWAVMGVVQKSDLLAFSSSFRMLLFAALLLSSVVGVIGIVFVARQATKRIGSLAVNLRSADPRQPIRLAEVGVAEIDQLSEAIVSLSTQVADNAQKMSRILDMAGIEIGVFEQEEDGAGFYYTDKLPGILGIRPGERFDSDVLRRRLEALPCQVEQGEQARYLFTLNGEDGVHWVRLQTVARGANILGVLIDVTKEISEKQKLEHERDYDLLTGLFNRRAFQSRIEQMLARPEEVGVAVLVMMDLDNLKYVNDTYGHDFGDSYIRAAARALRRSTPDKSLAARLSGDEFVAFLYGYDNMEGAREACRGIEQELRRSILALPDGSRLPVRASAGLSFFPKDAVEYAPLLQYADFAMYQVKHTDKGQFTEFNIATYNRDAYLLQCREELNLLIEKERLDYQFQPIVDAVTGGIFGYEALMRPATENIHSPAQLLELARSQSKLSQIERLTMFRAMECAVAQGVIATGSHIFINSIPNQVLSDQELTRMEERFGRYLDRLVIELTEEERMDPEKTVKKQAFAKKWGASLALDDFGVGYSGEGILVDLAPQFVKIDISLVQGIERDEDRQALLSNLVLYCKKRRIRLIGEGVETFAEMEYLIRAGVDYLQGYYLCRPAHTPPERLPCKKEILAIRSKM